MPLFLVAYIVVSNWLWIRVDCVSHVFATDIVGVSCDTVSVVS